MFGMASLLRRNNAAQGPSVRPPASEPSGGAKMGGATFARPKEMRRNRHNVYCASVNRAGEDSG